MQKKKKILILLPHFLPGYKLGGPLASILNIITTLSEDYEFMVITIDRDLGDKKPYANIEVNKWLDKGTYQVYYVRYNLFMPLNIIRQIRIVQTDILYINSFFDFFFSIPVILASKINLLKAKKIILAPRGELLEGSLNLSNFKKKLYIQIALKFKLYEKVFWHASTEIEKLSIIHEAKARNEHVYVALNITIVEIALASSFAEVADSQDYNYLHIVFISRLTEKKNLTYALDVLQHIKTDIIFDIYGPIEDFNMWQSCLKKIKQMPQNIRINYKGAISRENVRQTFRAYDLFLFPTLSENFGHVIAESLSVGTAVLISDQTPWLNLEARGLGWDFSLSKPDLFIDTIEHLSKFTREQLEEKRKHLLTIVTELLRNEDEILAHKNLFDTFLQ